MIGLRGDSQLNGAAVRGRRWALIPCVLLCLIAVVLLPGCATGSAGTAQDDRPSPQEIAALASEAVEALDEAVAVAAGQLEEAAEVVSEAVADGDLGVSTPGQITVGTNADFLPFVGKDDAGQLIGFDIELMEEVARRIGVQASYLDMPFSNLTGAVTSGEVDVVIAAITVTTQRDEVIDFSRPYFAASQALAAPPGSALMGLDDLTGDTVLAVLSDTTGEAYAEENFGSVVVAPYPDRASAFSALTAGSADAVFIDTDAISEQAREGTLVLLEEVPTSERYAIGMSEGTAPLRAAISTALTDIIDDGTYRDIFQRWFPGRDVDQALNILR